MKNIHTKLNRTIISGLLVAAMVGLASTVPVKAEDTDIYFSNPNAVTSTVHPNIMLILDTSGSMNTIVSGTGKTRLNNMKDALITILDNTSNVNMGLMRFSGTNAGPVLYPVANLNAMASDIEGTTVATVQSSISQGSDDAEQNTATGTVTTTSTSLDLINDGAADQVVGLRFQNVNIPRGATVTSAVIKFTAQSTAPVGATDLVIRGELSPDAATFTTAASNISTRAPTAASVAWASVPLWTTVGITDLTPDLKNIVNEITGSGTTWCGGNSMVFTITGTTLSRRIADSYEGNPNGAPVLIVSYDPTTIPVGSGCTRTTLQAQVVASNDDAEQRVSNGNMSRTSSTLQLIRSSGNDQTVGVRFQNLAIPQGATISSASIEFTIKTQDATATSLTVYGQNTNSASQFGSSNYDISGRTKTTASVSWPSLPNPAVNSKLTTPEIKTVVQEIVNRAGWASGNNMAFILTGSGTRNAFSYDDTPTKAAVLRVTYQTNATAASANNILVRERLKNIVSEMLASGATPIVDSLYEAGLYFRGQNVHYGLKRGDQSGTDARYTRISIPASYTGASGVYRAEGCTSTDLNVTACETEEIQGTPAYISPFTAGCQTNHIVLLTDGDPTVNNSVALIETMIGKTCAATTPSYAKCSKEVAAYYYGTDLSGLADKQNIVVHTVGFNNDGDFAYLQSLATAGGGTSHTASTASELTTVFEDIINTALKLPTSFVSPSLSVNAFNKLFNSDDVYFSLFTPDTTVAWAGNIKKFKLCTDPVGPPTCTYGEIIDSNKVPAISGSTSKIISTAQSYWSSTADGPEVKIGGAGENIPVYTSRHVYTYTGASDLPTPSVDLSVAGGVHEVNITNVTPTMLGNAAMTATTQQNIIDWMLGKNVQPETIPTGTIVASGNRWAFADALHSRPVTVTYGYSASNVPITKILVGTNDGALRMTNSDNGIEQWAVYIPDFLAAQDTLRDNANGTHAGGLDGSPTVWTIDNNRNGKIEPASPQYDKVYLYIGERRGGRNIYAFDLTPAGTLTDPALTTDVAPKYLWRIRGGIGDFSALGQTWSKPVLAKIRVKGATAGDSVLKDVLIFGGGFDPAQDDVMPSGADTLGNAIYIVDPLTGSLVWSAGNTGSGAAKELAAMNYSIPADISAVDTDGDGAVDRLYAADTRGQIFRIDLGSQINPAGADATAKNGGSSGYVFADVGCTGGIRSNHCSITAKYERRKFFYAPDVAQVRDPTFSSTPDYALVSIESGDREDPLDKITGALSVDPVHNRIYAFRDVNTHTGAPASVPAALADSNLYDATGNALQDTAGAGYAAALSAIQAAKGWYIDLKTSTSPYWFGEKGLAKTTVFGGILYATTYSPVTTAVSACDTAAEGTGYLYAMNYLNGTAISDLDNNGSIERSISVGGGIPSEIVIVIREGGVTALVGTSGGAKTPKVDSTLPRYPTFWYDR